MKKIQPTPQDRFSGIPIEEGKVYQFMNAERGRSEKGMGEVVKFLKKKKKLPKYTPPEPDA